MNQKAISHLEVILSFVIFLSFLIFVMAIFNPFKGSDKSRIYLDVLERGITQETGIKVSFLTIELNTVQTGCFCFDYDLRNVSVRANGIYKTDAYSIPQGLSSRICIGSSDKKFFDIYSSSEFGEKVLADCTNLDRDKYTLGLFRESDFTSNKSLAIIRERYLNNYNSLKNELGLSSSEEFSFVITDSLGNVIYDASRNIPKTKVMARSLPIQIVFESGEFKSAILNIKIW